MANSKSTLFSECKDRRELMFQFAGAASMCWEKIEKAGTFDSVTAKEISEDALLRLNELDQED